MLADSVYYIFSLVLTCGILLALGNMILLRTKRRSTFGFSVKRGTPEYERAKALTNNRNMTYAALALIVLLINLVYSIVNLLHMNELRYAHNLIFYGGAFIVLMFIFMVLTIGRWQGRVAVEIGRAQKELRKSKITK